MASFVDHADIGGGFRPRREACADGVKVTQPSDQVRDRLRAAYEQDPAQLIATSQVIAIHFQTIATANDHRRS